MLHHDFNDCQPVTQTLTSRAKYNLILPVLINIPTLASCHCTEKFMECLESMKKVEEAVRTGDNSLPRTVDASSPPASHSITLPVEPYSRICPLPSSASTLPQLSKFQLKFRKKLKARGSPKKAVWQLCSFNKSAAGRVPRKRANTDSASTISRKR